MMMFFYVFFNLFFNLLFLFHKHDVIDLLIL